MKELIIVVLALMGFGVVIFGLICVWYFVTEKNAKEVMEMKKYLVTMDGWTAGYGAEIYAVGLFDTPEKAEEAVKKCIGKCHECSVDIQPDFTISEVTEGEIHLPKGKYVNPHVSIWWYKLDSVER